jgi:hypothetical protein
MIGNFSGIEKVEYDTQLSFATVVDLGKPLAESDGFAPETQIVETGKGTNLYAGKKHDSSYLIPDMSKFAALETLMKADTEIFVRVTDTEDNVETIAEEASVQVKKMLATAVGTRTHFEFKFQHFAV